MENKSVDKKIKESIDSLSQSPQFSFDKNTAWGKLERSLENKTDRKRVYLYYWAIAASVLLLLWVFVGQPPNKKTFVTIAKDSVKPIVQHKTEPKEYPTATPANKETGTKKKDTSIHKQKLGKKNGKEQRENLIAVNTLITKEQVKKHDSSAPIQVLPKPIVAKKEMKVVHINEVMEEGDEIKIPAPGKEFFWGGNQYANTNSFANPKTNNYPFIDNYSIAY